MRNTGLEHCWDGRYVREEDFLIGYNDLPRYNWEKIKRDLQAIIDNTTSLKSSYFWTSGRNKEWTEKQYTVDFFEFYFDGHNYTFKFIVNCSRNHVYIDREYTVDGVKKDLRLVKKVLKMLE